MMGEDFRVEQLRYVNKDDYQRLYKQVFWDRVHPIYRMYEILFEILSMLEINPRIVVPSFVLPFNLMFI